MAGTIKIDFLQTDRGITLTGGARSTPCTGSPGIVNSANTVTIDLNQGNNFEVTLVGPSTLANFSNMSAGQAGHIEIIQDGTGSRTLAYGSQFKFPGNSAPVASTTASSIDLLTYYVASNTEVHINILKGLAR